jgi:hypothetical protein
MAKSQKSGPVRVTNPKASAKLPSKRGTNAATPVSRIAGIPRM